MKQLGLLVRLIIGIIAGMLIGLCGGWFGIADTTGFVAVIRLLATFTSLFSTFLSFMIPLIIIASSRSAWRSWVRKQTACSA